MEFKNIRLEKRDRVAFLTLNRPQALNALNPELVGEICQAVAQVKADQEVKALVISGEGSLQRRSRPEVHTASLPGA